MKSCIYQNRSRSIFPGRDPHAQGRARAALRLEIYSLLTRWNPLDLRRPFRNLGAASVCSSPAWDRRASGSRTTDERRPRRGCIDGLKIEPLPPESPGSVRPASACPFARSARCAKSTKTSPIASWRVSAASPNTVSPCVGIRISSRSSPAARAARAVCPVGGVRFGGTLTVEDAAELGFDHLALCMGAGRPTVLDIPNGLARGVRAAFRFPHGAATHRRGQSRFDRQHAVALPVVVIAAA